MLARQRKGELKRLNEQLRQINAALRRQAKIESYAPTLSYAPVGGRTFESDVIVDPRKEELISRLKSGKNFLRNQDPEKAFLDFKTALELAQGLQDPIKEKKAARGLGLFSITYLTSCFLYCFKDKTPSSCLELFVRIIQMRFEFKASNLLPALVLFTKTHNICHSMLVVPKDLEQCYLH